MKLSWTLGRINNKGQPQQPSRNQSPNLETFKGPRNRFLGIDSASHARAPFIRSFRGTWVVFPDFQPMRVSEEPVCILFLQNQFLPPCIRDLPFMSYRLCTLQLIIRRQRRLRLGMFSYANQKVFSAPHIIHSEFAVHSPIADRLLTPFWPQAAAKTWVDLWGRYTSSRIFQ